MSNVEINIIEGSISDRPLSDLVGEGDWKTFSNGLGCNLFRSRGGAVRSIRSEFAHYPSEQFVAYVGQLDSGAWCALYRVAAA